MSSALSMLFVFALFYSGHSNEFLKAPKVLHDVSNEHVSEQDIQTSLLSEVESTLGTGPTNKLSEMEEMLRPIAAALPKNEHGNLGHNAVRYALHRLFVQRHGWVIKGLDDANRDASPSLDGVLKNQVPVYIQALFEKRLVGKGLSLHELATLGATIEHLIHNEAVGRLGAVFNVFSLPVTSLLSNAEASEVLDTYMMAYILGEDLNNMTLTEARENNLDMPDIFLAWHDTQEFVHAVRRNLTGNVDRIDFAALANVVETVGEQFGTFQDTECRQLKNKLVKMEYRGTGRVKLSDFYKPVKDGSWQFQESVGYLRKLGLLDESNPEQPSVMLANYINSQSNCIASSGFYSVCCKNECEGLLGQLEEKLNASEAKPTTIAGLVWKMPSSTVSSPRDVSANLFQRLEDIASGNGGMVPLHGRLFAQWMHHAYPRECPYPHVAGTISALSPEEWMDQSGNESTASEEEVQRYLVPASNVTDQPIQKEGDLEVEELMPWSPEEELLVVRTAPSAKHWDSSMSASASIRTVMLLAAAGSLGFGVIQTFKSAASGGEAPLKRFV